jgi:hypothetical protein
VGIEIVNGFDTEHRKPKGLTVPSSLARHGFASEAALHGYQPRLLSFFLRNSPFNMHGNVYLRLSNSCRCEVYADHEEPSLKRDPYES